jgi:aryl-alcohol dehydrogenase-like predicted oxidoreductase
MMHNHYSIIDRRGLELAPACTEKRIGMINASPFGCGVLTGGSIADWHPADAGERRVFAEAARFCEEQGSSIAKLAFQFASRDHPFHTTMFSTARTRSLQRNLKWFGEPLDRDLLDRVRGILAPVLDKQWDWDAGIDRMDEGQT